MNSLLECSQSLRKLEILDFISFMVNWPVHLKSLVLYCKRAVSRLRKPILSKALEAYFSAFQNEHFIPFFLKQSVALWILTGVIQTPGLWVDQVGVEKSAWVAGKTPSHGEVGESVWGPLGYSKQENSSPFLKNSGSMDHRMPFFSSTQKWVSYCPSCPGTRVPEL